jgi:hypothetical protein
MDQDRFFHEIDRQAEELDVINLELNELAEQAIEQRVQDMYDDFIQSMLSSLYEEFGF